MPSQMPAKNQLASQPPAMLNSLFVPTKLNPERMPHSGAAREKCCGAAFEKELAQKGLTNPVRETFQLRFLRAAKNLNCIP